MFRHINHIHFVGIGGIGMSGIAELLKNLGYKVSGSDIKESKITKRLESLGITVYYSHKKENITTADVVVYSSAIPSSNVELKEAKRRKLPTISRVEMLGELMRMKQAIGVAGTHGKTTTTSMIGKILEDANLDPTIIVGGILKASGRNTKLGEGDFLVCEIDESDKRLVTLSPVINVITSIDEEHLERYRDLEEIKSVFLKFTNRVPFYGCNILCNEDENVRELISKTKRRFITYGLRRGSDLRVTEYTLGRTPTFRVKLKDEDLGRFKLKLVGLHNILNACASLCVGVELGIDVEVMRGALFHFKGTHRRFENKGIVRGVRFIDDYAHHPEEIKVTLKTAKELFPTTKIYVIFQPHLYSRTQRLRKKFATSFVGVEFVIITKIYPAREKEIEGVSGELIVNEAKKAGINNIKYIEEKEEIINWCKHKLNVGDILFTMGAGDVDKLGEEIMEELKK